MTPTASHDGPAAHEARAAWLFLAPGLLGDHASSSSCRSSRRSLLSLTDFDIYALGDSRNARFVGLRNYANLLADPLFWKAMRNTPSSSSSAAR